MKIVRHIEEVPFNKNSVITVGTFDGVHAAHQKIINTVVEEARLRNGRSIIVTFDPHPREILKEQTDLRLLTTLDERGQLCENLGVDWMYVIRFDYNFSLLSFRDFYLQYLINGIGVDVVIEGYNHHWGRDREGNIDALVQLGKEFNFDVIRVEPFNINDKEVNSSLIRISLDYGNVEEAIKFLGRPYSLKGKVIEGDKRGRQLGYPTANLELDNSKKLVPKNGIYFGFVFIEQEKHFGMISIGERPTFYSEGKRIIEVNILNYDNNIYGSEIRIEFLKRLRDEVKYNSAEDLVAQMNIDEKISLDLKNEYKNFMNN